MVLIVDEGAVEVHPREVGPEALKRRLALHRTVYGGAASHRGVVGAKVMTVALTLHGE